MNDAVSNKKIGTIIESEVQAKWAKIKDTKGGSLLIEKAFDNKKKMKVTVEKFRNPDRKWFFEKLAQTRIFCHDSLGQKRHAFESYFSR